MFNLGDSFKFLTLVRGEGGRTPSRAGVRHHVNLEILEGRALLSHVAAAHAKAVAPAVDVQPVAITHLPRHPHPGPIVNNVGVGYAVKSPRFYEFYTGPKRGELNAAGMKATYDAAGNLVLTGIIAGTINAKPTSLDQSEYYVFGIDRGLTTGAGPFTGRPNIRVDTAIAVAVTPAGTHAVIADIHAGTATALNADAVAINGDNIKVYVPAGTPGIEGVNGFKARAVFWTQDAAPSFHPNASDIASFAPDGRTVEIAGAPGQTPNHHLL